MPTPEAVRQALADFAELMPSLQTPEGVEYPVIEVSTRHRLSGYEWANASGIYCIFRNGHLKYIGRSLAATGLANRVLEQTTAFGDPLWDDVIKDPTSTVMVIPLQAKDTVWVASLELYLLDRFPAGLVNKRRV